MKFDFKRKILKSGMTILFEKRDIPVVSVAFAVRNGGINEAVEEKGISHFIEHMFYKGTPKRNAKKIAEEIEKNGGILNGFTSETITAFWCKMPSKHLDVALDVLSDMVRNSLFDEKELEKERKVIFEEIKRNHDIPMRHVIDEAHNSLYEEPFGIPLLGTLDAMNSIDKKKMSEKFKEIYQPNNMILCVVGNADFGELVKFVERNFEKGKGVVPLPKIKLKNESKIEKRKGIDQANLVFAFHVPVSTDKKNYAAQVLNTLMGVGLSSRLHQEIREKRNLAYAVSGDMDSGKDYAYNLVYVGTSKENVELVKELILKEFEKVAKDLGEKELAEIKEQMIGNYQISMEDSQNQMVNLLLSEIDGNAEEFYEFEKNISDVKLEDVKDLAKIKNYSFFALVPE